LSKLISSLLLPNVTLVCCMINGFALLPSLLEKARVSPFWLWLVNQLLGWLIPFNRPHGFRILALEPERVRTGGSYRRRNRNHIAGIHACAIATVAEFSSGLMLLTKLDPARYRLIMAELQIEYLYQAKSAICAETALDALQLEQAIIAPLQSCGTLRTTLETLITDADDRLVAVATITWQIKRWDEVRTRLA